MKTIILAGGLGTRISEETDSKPKPMVLIDEYPILWHVMNIYASQGFDDFVIATGYKGEVIHDWVQTLDTEWDIQTLDTGSETQTGGRIKKCMQFIPNERFFVTYGDGLANVNLKSLLDFHAHQGRKATVTAVRPPARFGVLESVNGQVTNFGEKRQADSGWINGGFFVLESNVEADIYALEEPFETGALPRLVKQQQLTAFHHEGFWQPMDTLRERNLLSDYSKLDPVPWLKFN
jgi:glucose-1-phosphate cytidylyltransferase